MERNIILSLKFFFFCDLQFNLICAPFCSTHKVHLGNLTKHLAAPKERSRLWFVGDLASDCLGE